MRAGEEQEPVRVDRVEEKEREPLAIAAVRHAPSARVEGGASAAAAPPTIRVVDEEEGRGEGARARGQPAPPSSNPPTAPSPPPLLSPTQLPPPTLLQSPAGRPRPGHPPALPS